MNSSLKLTWLLSVFLSLLFIHAGQDEERAVRPCPAGMPGDEQSFDLLFFPF
jgi:hypothetical protein